MSEEVPSINPKLDSMCEMLKTIHTLNERNKILEKENERLRTRCEQARDEGTGYMQQLEKENADSLNNKLEEDNYNLTCNLNVTLDQLNEATELLKATLLMAQVEGLKGRYETVDDIEQFLKDCDIDNAIQQANKGLDFDKIADEMEQDLKDSEVEK